MTCINIAQTGWLNGPAGITPAAHIPVISITHTVCSHYHSPSRPHVDSFRHDMHVLGRQRSTAAARARTMTNAGLKHGQV